MLEPYDLEKRQRHSLLAVNLGLAANLVLAGLKTGVGILGNSPALLADGVNSTSDVAYYLVVSIFMRLARKPADHAHPYGHSQLESIAALIVGAFVITTAVAIFWDAVNTVYSLWKGSSDFLGAAPLAVLVALLTVILKLFLTILTRQIGKRTDNPAVLALAYDHRNDIFSSSAAAIGIFLGRQGLPWVDPLAGAIVALVILRTGLEIVRRSSEDLMDAVPSRALAQQIQALLLSIPGVLQVEEVHAHRFGPYLVTNLTIGIDGSLTVQEGDRIASDVEDCLLKNIPLMRRVHVHFHPAKMENKVGQEQVLPQHLVALEPKDDADDLR